MSHPSTVASTTVTPTTVAPRVLDTVPGDAARVVPARRTHPLAATAVALGLFAVARLTGIVVLAVVARAVDKHPLALLGRSWDSPWYLHIAEHGYGRTMHFDSGRVFSDLAFFPVYPVLVRAVTAITGLSAGGAGLLVSWAGAAGAACGIYAIGLRLRGRVVGTLLVLLWGLLPHSVVLSLAYSEPLLTAFAAWSLYAVLSGRWVWAGGLAALAGLSRPNGFAVAAAVLVAAAHEIVRRRPRQVPRGRPAGPRRPRTPGAVPRPGKTPAVLGPGTPRAVSRHGKTRSVPRPEKTPAVPRGLWAGAAIAPLGWGGYVLWVGMRTGNPLGGYFAVQHGWGSAFDLGRGSLRTVRTLAVGGGPVVYPMTIMIVAAAVLLFALLLVERVPLPLLVYSGALLVVTLGGSGYFCSKPRFLLPAFPLLLPMACALARTARARPWHATLVVTALAGLSYAYGAHLVVLSRTAL
nr:hypothetical protein [Streptomyces cavernae]